MIPQVSIDDNDNILAIWEATDGGNSIIQTSLYTLMGGQWGMPVTLSDSQGGVVPQLKLNGSDVAIAAWTTFQNTIAEIETAVFKLGLWGGLQPIITNLDNR